MGYSNKKQTTAIEGVKTPIYDRLEEKAIEKFTREFMAKEKKNAFVLYVYGNEQQIVEFWKTMDQKFREEINKRFDL